MRGGERACVTCNRTTGYESFGNLTVAVPSTAFAPAWSFFRMEQVNCMRPCRAPRLERLTSSDSFTEMGWRNARVWDAYIEPGKWDEMRLGKRDADRIPGTMALAPLWMGFVSLVSWQNASTWGWVKTCVAARLVVVGAVVVVGVEAALEDSTRWRR